MKNIKKFNEDFADDFNSGVNHDDNSDNNPEGPITMDTIKAAILNAMMDMNNEEVDVNNPKFEEGINKLAENIMSSFQDTLAYISENHEGEIEDILSTYSYGERSK